MSRILFVLLFLCCSWLVQAHGGKKYEPGQWHQEILTLKLHDNWGMEHCMTLNQPRRLQYEFESIHAMKFNLHVHPENENNEYQTENFLKLTSVKSKSGEIQAVKPGAYCFSFNPEVRLTENAELRLKFRLD